MTAYTAEDFAYFAGLAGEPYACKTGSERRAWLIGFAVRADGGAK